MAKKFRAKTIKIEITPQDRSKFASACAFAGLAPEAADKAAAVWAAMRQLQQWSGGQHIAFDVLAAAVPASYARNWAVKAIGVGTN